MEKIYKGEIQRLLPIFQAMADGKTIQTKNGIGWIDIDGDEYGLNLDSIINYQDFYRIKPESKYRPFKNAEEFWHEMQKHQPFGWLNGDKCFYNIVSVSNIDVSMANVSGDIVTLDFSEVMEDNTFYDGTPFGIKFQKVNLKKKNYSV